MSEEKILNLIRPEYLKLEKYSEPRSGKNVISLSSNENPYSFRDDKEFNRYPTVENIELKEKLANLYNVSLNNIAYGKGSTELIQMLIKLFCIPYKDSVILCPPTYMLYSHAINIECANCINIPLINDYQLDVDKIIENGKKSNVKLIFIPNPNAPLGTIMNKNDILKIADALKDDCYIVIDEAYIEWTNEESFVNYVKDYANIGVLRTLSKYYGLANLRIGVFVGNEKIKDNLEKILLPFAIPTMIMDIAVDALNEKYFNFYKKNKETILLWRNKIIEELKKLDYIDKVFQSHTNFILATSKYSEEIIDYLDKNNVVILSQSAQVPNSLRISIGTPQENEVLIDLLKKWKKNN